MEALVHANTTLAKGFEEIGKHLITFTQVECERAAAAAKATLAVKSLRDAIALNNAKASSITWSRPPPRSKNSV